MSHLMVGTFRRALLATVAAVLLMSWPPTPASASTRVVAALSPSTLGGTTGQDLPVVVDVNAAKTQVVRIVTVLQLTCQPSARTVIVPDVYRRLVVTRGGRFHAAFGPLTQRNDDGTTTDFSGRMTGLFSRSHAKVGGTWRLTAVTHDAAGAVTDSCASPLVSWHAKQ